MKDAYRIAILDDSLDMSKIHIKNNQFTFQMKSSKKYQNSENMSHGTACFLVFISILNKLKNPKDHFTLTFVSIVDDSEKQTVSALCESLKWCIDHDIKLIGLSAGSLSFIYARELIALCETAYKKGIIIVSALSNTGDITYPGSLSSTIGVRISDRLKPGEILIDPKAFNGVEIVCNMPVLSEITSKNMMRYHIPERNNSLATAWIAGGIASRIFDTGFSKQNVYDILYKHFNAKKLDDDIGFFRYHPR